MAQQIRLKRSAVTGKTPLTTDVALGELAINTFDGKMFFKRNNGTESIIELSNVGHTHALGTLTGVVLTSPSTNQVLQFNGTNWVNATIAGSGTVTSVALSGGTTGLTVTGSPITTSGTLTLGGTLNNSATTATSANTASTIVARDGSGNFTAGTITAALTGNASTASTLQTARTLTIAGTDKSFNGSANVSWTANELAVQTFNNTGEGHGTRTSFDATTPSYGFGWRFIQGSTNGPGTGGSQFYSLYTGLGTGYSATGAGSYGMHLAIDRNSATPYLSVRFNENNSLGTWRKIQAGNADTATTLQTARTINGTSFNGSANITTNSWGTSRTLSFTGDVTGSSAVDGSANVATAMTLANSGVTAGTHTKVTVDAKGRVTAGTTLAATDIPNLDASKITSGVFDQARLPSYVDDVLEYANLASFPGTGETGKIYVALDTNKTYRWSGSAYIYITSGAVDSVAGKTGVVTLVKGDVGLGNVDNTADASKNVATAATLTTARTLTIGDTGKTFNGSANVSWSLAEIGGTTTNTANKLVLRDGSGNFSAGTISATGVSITSSATTTAPVTITASSLQDGVGILRLVGSEPDIVLNDTNGGWNTLTFENNGNARVAIGRNNNNSFYLAVRDPAVSGGAWKDGVIVADSSTGNVSMAHALTVSNNFTASGTITLHGAQLGSSSGTAPKYFARAWVNFNGTGTPAIRDSGNVSSITDGGTGEFQVNFTTALPNTNYAAVNGSNNYNQGQPCEISISYGATSAGQFNAGNTTPRVKTTEACRFTCGIGNATGRIDPYEVHIVFYS